MPESPSAPAPAGANASNINISAQNINDGRAPQPHALKGTLVNNNTPSYPFIYPKQLSNDDAPKNSLELQASPAQQLSGNLKPSAPANAGLFHFGQIKRYLQNTTIRNDESIVIPTRPDTTDTARWKSLLARFSDAQEADSKGFAENSPLARMNTVAAPRGMQRKFFHDHARASKFISADVQYDDKTLKELLELEKQEAVGRIGGYTRSERGFFALERARLAASGVSLKQYQTYKEVEDQKTDDQKAGDQKAELPKDEDQTAMAHLYELDKHNEFMKNFRHETLTQQMGAAADHAEGSLDFRDGLNRFTNKGIEAGVRELEFFLDPTHDANSHFGDLKERQKIVQGFRDACKAYNGVIDDRIAARHAQFEKLHDTPLRHLGLPVELRGDAHAKGLLVKARHSIEVQKGWAPDNSFGSWLKGVAKDFLAVAGRYLTLGILPLVSSRFRNFANSRLSYDYRMSRIEGGSRQEQARELRIYNRKLAENWVKEQYKIDPDTKIRAGAHIEKLDDPHGLFSAIQNFSRDEIVDGVKTQLRLSAESTLLADREAKAKALREAKQRGVDPGDTDKEVANQDYYIDDFYLSQVAEGIVDGMSDGLYEALNQQVDVREASEATSTANTYVKTIDRRAEMIGNRAWDAVDAMLSGNFYLPTRKTDFDLALKAQEKELADIEFELLLAEGEDGKGGKIPAGFSSFTDKDVYLPQQGPRLAHLQKTAASTRLELTDAKDAASFIDTFLGGVDKEGSLLWVEAGLYCDQKGLGLESGDTEDACRADFETRRQSLETLQKGLIENYSLLFDEQLLKLDDMITDLQSRAKYQRDIRLAIIDLDGKMRAATTSADLDKLENEFKDNINASIRNIETSAGWSEQSNIEELLQDIKALRSHAVDRLRSTRDVLAANAAANAAARQTIDQIGTGEVSLDIGLGEIDKAFDGIEQQNNAHREKWINFDGIGDKFPLTNDMRSSRRAEALLTALKIDHKLPDVSLDPRDPTEEAETVDARMFIQKVDFLYKAGVLNDRFADGLMQDLKRNTEIKGGVPTFADAVKALAKLGADEAGKNYAPKFANSIYPDTETEKKADLRLKLTLDLLRQAGVGSDGLLAATRAHYQLVARFALSQTINGALQDAFRAVISAETGLRRTPRNLKEQLDSLQFLFNKYPVLFPGKTGREMRDAIGYLQALLYHPDKPLNELQIAKAVTLAEQLAQINSAKKFDPEKIAAAQLQYQREGAAKLQGQIAHAFGFADASAFADGKTVKAAARNAITDAGNQDGLQDLNARSNHVQALVQVHQKTAQLIEGAVLQPLKDFAEQLNESSDAEVTTAADAREVMESPEFLAKAHALENLNRFLAADDNVRRDQSNLNTDNATYRANLQAMTVLSRELRQFDPETMQAGGNSLTNRVAMWWNEETPDTVAKELRGKGVEKIADKFVTVWKHLRILNALSASNDELSKDMVALADKSNKLLNKVQRHRRNQLAMAAVLTEFEKSGKSADDFKLDKTRIGQIQKRLNEWGQPGAWETLRQDYKLEENSFSQSLLDKWQADNTGLPDDIQDDFDALKEAVANFETLVKTLAASNAAMIGSDIEHGKLPSLEEQQKIAAELEGQLLRVKRTQARAVLPTLLAANAQWTNHAAWKGGESAKSLSTLRLGEFSPYFCGQLKQRFRDHPKAVALINLLEQTVEFDSIVRSVKSVLLGAVKPSDDTIAELRDKADKLAKAADPNELNPKPKGMIAQLKSMAKGSEDEIFLDVLAKGFSWDIQSYVAGQMAFIESAQADYLDPSIIRQKKQAAK
ncbi:MAG: hypothetical protein AAF936_08515 [Pseudomonadota bacterium]